MTYPSAKPRPARGHIPFNGHRTLAEVLGITPGPVTVARIKKAVAAYHGINVEDLTGSSRLRNIAWARQEGMYLSRRLTKHSTIRIGQWFNRDHSTVISNCLAVERRRETNPQTARTLELIEKALVGE